MLITSVLLGLAGLGGGLVLGRGLRPTPAVTASAPSLTDPAPVADTDALVRLQAEVAGLLRARDDDQARLASLAQARIAAEAELANLRRDLAAARRDISPPPAPSAQAAVTPVPPPRSARAEPPPATGQPRVFIHMRAGSAAAADAAANLIQPLREAGFDLSDLRPVTSTPSQRVVRYFHSEDAAAAARLAGRLGRGWAIQDFRGYEPAPSMQTLEIWLPDR